MGIRRYYWHRVLRVRCLVLALQLRLRSLDWSLGRCSNAGTCSGSYRRLSVRFQWGRFPCVLRPLAPLLRQRRFALDLLVGDLAQGKGSGALASPPAATFIDDPHALLYRCDWTRPLWALGPSHQRGGCMCSSSIVVHILSLRMGHYMLEISKQYLLVYIAVFYSSACLYKQFAC